jgi:AcrR family transcriptional regulator
MARKRDIEGQRETLSLATWAVLAEGGLTRLTLRAVAERAGCSTGLVLHTFPDRHALLVHARRRLRDSAAARVDKAEKASATPQEALREVLLAVLALGTGWSDEPRVWMSFLVASLDDTDLAQHHRDGNRALVARVTRLLQASHDEWDDERVRTTAMALVALVEGFNILGSGDPDSYPPPAQRAAVLAALDALDRTP